jgi:hypothetical protein
MALLLETLQDVCSLVLDPFSSAHLFCFSPFVVDMEDETAIVSPGGVGFDISTCFVCRLLCDILPYPV